MPEIQLSHGTIQYRDQGSGPTVVLIHGLLVNARIWDQVVERLAPNARCIVPDLPLGSHPRAMAPDADLTPRGVAKLIAELLEKLDLDDVTLVGNDTGGALCQLVCAHHPQRIGALVLTNCDAFEHFPPPAFSPIAKVLARVPGAVRSLEFFGRARFVRQAAVAPLVATKLDDGLVRSWTEPLRDAGVRRDLIKFLREMSPRDTLEAAERLPGFEAPVVLIWGLRDKFFPLRDGERLRDAFPHARLEQVENARTFVQLDAPERVAELVAQAAAATLAAA